MAEETRRLRRRLWLAAASLVGILIIVGLFQAARMIKRHARRFEHAQEMRWLGMSLRQFDDVYKRLPPAVRRDKAGRALCSWRYQVFPFLFGSMMTLPAPDFGEPWDSPTNRYWASQGFRFYCWSPKGSPEQLHTNVLAITGSRTPFDKDREIGFKDMNGGTILLVEVAHSGIHWMEPGDISLEQIPSLLTQGAEGDGFHVLFADGEVWFLSPDVPVSELKNLCTIEGAKKHDREQVLGRYVVSRYR